MAPKSILKRFGLTGLAAIIVARFSRWLNSPCRLTAPDGSERDRAWIGNYGENVATDFLRSHGCRILARNFKARRGGEVDIVARDGKLLLFVEVKTRREGAKIRPLDAVDKPKQKLIERGANTWLKHLGTRNLPWRFDVIEVWVQDGAKPRVNHVRDAF
jgi:putative endonuclease